MVSRNRPFVVAFWTTLFSSVLCILLMLANRGPVAGPWRADVAPPPPPLSIDVDTAALAAGPQARADSQPHRATLGSGEGPIFVQLPIAPDLAFPISRDLPRGGPYGEFRELMHGGSAREVADATPIDATTGGTDAKPLDIGPPPASVELTRLQDEVVSLRREIERLAEVHLQQQLQTLEARQQELLALEQEGFVPQLRDLMKAITEQQQSLADQQQSLAEAEQKHFRTMAEAAAVPPAPLPPQFPAGTSEEPISLRIEIAELSPLLDQLIELTREAAVSRRMDPPQATGAGPETHQAVSQPSATEVVQAPLNIQRPRQESDCLCCHRARVPTAVDGSRGPSPLTPRPTMAFPGISPSQPVRR